ncbi:MAG: TerB N-terminal domain-containing protein, partial [Candidatus Thiodiazotropha sp. (ex Semelilucina semeliformis)]|nr:TerB N-terminal domain-containing protein [Candidatus Thiodiazotropha sp. (ex Semelilucina semeliformis)]
MGRRKSSSASGWMLAGLLALGFIVQVIEEIWPLLLAIGVVVLIVWIISLFQSNSSDEQQLKIHKPRNSVTSGYKSRKSTHHVTPKFSTDGDSFWVPPGDNRSLQGYQLGDMIYVGKTLAGADNGSIEPALIDPSLSINKKRDDYTVKHLDYWPSYSDATREARAAYLNWLTCGREDPKADIGYVFLYFYGLERRALVDSYKSKNAREDLSAIETEIQRLLSVYGYNYSFHKYASSLRDWLDLRRGKTHCPMESPPLDEQGELSFTHRYCLGQFALSKTPLPASWAHTWLLGDPNTRLRTPAKRCPEIFRRAFIRQYNLDHGEGLKLPINKTRLKVIHTPGNRSLYRAGSTTLTLDQPDVTVLASPLKKLQRTAETCMEQLDGYSRYIGRNPDRAESTDALVELPFPLWPTTMQQRIAKLAYTLRTAGKPMATPFEKLQSLLPEWDGVTRKKYQGLTRVLSEAGLGIEPDFAFGGKLPKPDAKVVLFSDEHIATHPDATPEYAAAALTLRLAVAVSAADGNVGSEERDLLERQLEDWLHLDPSHRRRLQAHMRWLISDPPPLRNLKKHIEDLPTYAREAIGDFMTEVAKADNQVTPEEVKLLEKVYKLLDLEVQGLYSKLHTAAEGPVTVRPVGGSTTGHTIPPPPAPPAPAKPSDDLDMERIAVLHAESEKVSAILSKIFTETMPEPEPEPIPDPDDEIDTRDSLLSLDAAHSIFARKLLTR